MDLSNQQRYLGKKVVVLEAGSAKGEIGGAERFYQGLVPALTAKGCKADSISVQTDESSFEHILDNYARCKVLDLSNYDLVISTKAPTYAASHPNHLLYLVHTIRVFYDMFNDAFPKASPALLAQQEKIQDLDNEALGAIRHRFSIGHEVAKRLRDWNGIDCEVLHPPLSVDGFRCGEGGDYFFLPGRLHSWKRVDLVIRAVMASRLPIKLLIAGTGEQESNLKALARRDSRIQFLGRISDDKLFELYANALAVPFVPLREDYGYITLEAFASAKPVITCTDSGETLQFVRDRKTGLVCDPSPEGVRGAMELLFKDRELARTLGQRANQSTADMSWATVAERLLQAGFDPAAPEAAFTRTPDQTKVSIIDMQPIDPPVGGGRLRLLGLYHALGPNTEAQYIGTYDWPGEAFRRHKLSPTLEEIDIPLSAAHHAAASALAAETNGKTVIDLAFPAQVHLSPEYLKHARESIERAAIVVFSHPWAFPPLAQHLRPSQLVVYESHNVEGYLRSQFLNDTNPCEARLLRDVVKTELAAGARADLILACSAEDLDIFVRVYGWPADKIRVVPNGVMASSITPPTPATRAQAKARVGLSPERKAAIFIGSPYKPNVEAANFIVSELAWRLPDCDFVIAGGVSGTSSECASKNVIFTKQISESVKIAWLQACDFALNPMFSGSGTNIKMFDYMAAGLPVVTSRTGARGVSVNGRDPLIIVDSTPEAFTNAIRGLIGDQKDLERRSADARECVEDDYSWEAISPRLGQLLRNWSVRLDRPRPFFSVVIPTLDRHDRLDTAIRCLQAQREQDFEVVIVDQTSEPWARRNEHFGFPVTYVHTTVKGAARARNVGAFFAQGEILAFTDDDCLPSETWLHAARAYFSDATVHAVEGLIESDHDFEPEYRQVTNVDFEGFGFMTANLCVRASTFQRIGGFDLSFDRPSFREDTDLGWRVQEFGRTPFAKDVRVFHPAPPRSVERESHVERARYFEKDALLLKKHPEKYRTLFRAEGHWNKTEGFWENFSAGAVKYHVDISDFDIFRQTSYVLLCKPVQEPD